MRVFSGPVKYNAVKALVDIKARDAWSTVGIILVLVSVYQAYYAIAWLGLGVLGLVMMCCGCSSCAKTDQNTGAAGASMEFTWMALLALTIVVVGFAPQLLFHYISPGVDHLMPLFINTKLVG